MLGKVGVATDTGSRRSQGERGVRAWVVRWEWAGPHAAVDQPVAAVLSPRIGGANLLRLVETLHAAREYAPDEMLNAMRRNGRNPYPAKWQPSASCQGIAASQGRCRGGAKSSAATIPFWWPDLLAHGLLSMAPAVLSGRTIRDPPPLDGSRTARVADRRRSESASASPTFSWPAGCREPAANW